MGKHHLDLYTTQHTNTPLGLTLGTIQMGPAKRTGLFGRLNITLKAEFPNGCNTQLTTGPWRCESLAGYCVNTFIFYVCKELTNPTAI